VVIAFAMRAQDSTSASGGIVYTVAGTERVNVLKNQTYRNIGRNSFWFDVYRPEGKVPAKGWPVVVLIHGGPVPLTSHPKDWAAYRAYGRVLGASGVAAVTFNYRFATPGDLPEAASDVAAILEHLRAHASEYGIDPDRVCLWAFSGGGTQLATAIRDRPKSIRCLVSFYAALDTGPGQERYSPRAQLATAPGAEHIAPMFVARMGHDEPLISQSVDAFLAEAKRRGEPVEVVDYPQGIHAFDIDQDTNESRDVIARAIAFVKRHLQADSGVE
jgi:acetyl esterase/lipase